MADNSNYALPFQRRREQKTNYKQRLKLLKSGKPRLVVRTSNNHTQVHISKYADDGDQNTSQTVSKELEEYGWENHTGNLPAAYLTGFLAAKKAEVGEAILDTGLKEKNKGGRMFAAVQGAIDAGLEVPVGEKMVPSEGRLRGEHIEEITGENVTENFENVKEEIEGEFK